jgi:DNA repair protein endonuclease SAE2/CtIP C-terminus
MSNMDMSDYKATRTLFSSDGKITQPKPKLTNNAVKIKLKCVTAGPPGNADRRVLNSWKHERESKHIKRKKTVVRKKYERVLLEGYECAECTAYYKTFDLTPKELELRLKKCSRHKLSSTPPRSPEHFWEIDFPEDAECITRGYNSNKGNEDFEPLTQRIV